jgi:general secretion pathway protein I
MFYLKDHLKAYSKGFTLFEVLIALAILSLGLMAGLSTISRGARTTALLEDKTMAHWVAMNVIQSVALGLQREALEPSVSQGTLQMGTFTGYWDLEIKPERVADQSVLRMVVGVRAHHEGPVIAQSTRIFGASR